MNYIVLTLSILCFCSTISFSQPLTKAITGVAKASKKVPASLGRSASRIPVGGGVKVPPPVSVPVGKGSVGSSHQISPTSSIPAAPAMEDITAHIERQVLSLNRNLMLESVYAKEIGPLQAKYPVLESTFQAMPELSAKTNQFSGTIFKTTYNGKEEVYGVVAAHTLAERVGDKSLQRTFTVVVYPKGSPIPFEAEIVQVSSRRFLDLALVKFPEEVIPFLKPLTLAEEGVKMAETLQSHGYASSVAANIEGRVVKDIFPTSYRTTMPFKREARPGLCGSAVVNANHELVGIHTGSTAVGEDVMADVGFVVPSDFLNTLVKAYHNGGKGTFPFMLKDRKIADLNVDEYIHSIELWDAAEKKAIWRHNVENKFSYTKLYDALEQFPEAGFLRFTTRRAYWNEDGTILQENTTSMDKTKTSYKYDLLKNELVSVKPQMTLTNKNF